MSNINLLIVLIFFVSSGITLLIIAGGSLSTIRLLEDQIKALKENPVVIEYHNDYCGADNIGIKERLTLEDIEDLL